MGSSGSFTHPVMPARPSEAPITLRNPRREALSSHSEAPLGNSRCRASWNAGLPASSSSERQYSGPVFSAASCAVAKSIFSRTEFRSSVDFLPGQMSSRGAPEFLLSFVILSFEIFSLSPLRGLSIFWWLPHGLRRGLHSFAASRLRSAACRLILYRFAAHHSAHSRLVLTCGTCCRW